MTYVLQHTSTLQIYTCMLVNHYQLAYYGVKYWDRLETATEQYPAFLASQAAIDLENWQVVEMEESRMKLCNVKLKNDPLFHVFFSKSAQIDIKLHES